MLVHNGVMRQTLTTAEAAWIYRIDPRSFHRWATVRGVKPIRRQRIGRSTVAVWSIADLAAIGHAENAA